MSNEITPGKRVLIRLHPDDVVLTPGVVTEVFEDPEVFPAPHAAVLASGQAVTLPLREIKLGTQDTDPAAWMLHDGVTSKRHVAIRPGCYICEDPEFEQMGLPLCMACPACTRARESCGACGGTGHEPDMHACTDCLGTGWLGTEGHIAADDTVCDDCGYEHGPEDYQ